MSLNSSTNQADLDQASEWSDAAMLITGTMGARTAAEKRYYRCVWSVCILLAIWATWIAWPGHIAVPLWQKCIGALTPGVLFIFNVFEFRRYLSSLDELARKLQYESIAWTYLSGLVVWGFLFGLITAAGWMPGILAFGWFIFLEPLRGTLLYWFAHRYQ